ncbi:MAG: carboxymuconolactone decarboxylase family protein [Cyanobacteria bacterium KgW148]|nr:carboxymuconolactone decarboxylase family protein [Cyanobacteria bacterium KgW148]
MTGNIPSYQERTQNIRQHTSKIHQALPELMKSFYGLSKTSSTTGALDTKTKELIALAIAVAVRCDDCIAFHTQSALKEGATRAEIMEMLGVTIFMGGGPSLMYAAHVIEAMEEFQTLSTQE